MIRLLGMICAGAGSALGWWIGAHFGFMTAFFLSVLGSGAGLYYGTRLARRWLP